MRIRIAGILFVFFIILSFGVAQAAWLPKPDVEIQKIRKVVSKQMTEFVEKEDYFPPSLITTYSDAVMNSLDQNNGQVLIIAHDGLRNTKFTFSLDSNGNISKLTVQRYSKDIGKMFRNDNIDQSMWADLIQQFNTLGYATAIADGNFKYSYDFQKSAFLITKTKTSIRAQRECSLKIIQDGREIIPSVDNKISTYKLRADAFRIEVQGGHCSPGIFPIAESKHIEYLLQTPLIISSGGYGIAESSEATDVFGGAGGNDPSATIDEV